MEFHVAKNSGHKQKKTKASKPLQVQTVISKSAIKLNGMKPTLKADQEAQAVWDAIKGVEEQPHELTVDECLNFLFALNIEIN